MKEKSLFKRIASFALATMLVAPVIIDATSLKAKAAAPTKFDSVTAVNYASILGRATDYGITANSFTQNDHMESTLAAGTFANLKPSNTDVDFYDINNKDVAHFLIGEFADNSTQLWLDKNTAGTFYIEVGNSIYSDYNVDNGFPANGSNGPFRTGSDFNNHNPNVIVKNGGNSTKANVASIVDNAKLRSTELANKATNSDYNLEVSEYMDTDGYLDISDASFENKVVYIDINSNSGLKEKIGASSGLKIKKLSSTVIVFNLSNSDGSVGTDSITIAKTVVVVTDKSKTVTSETGSMGGQPANAGYTNSDVDSEICQKIIWNLRTSGDIQIDVAAGKFLAPYSSSVHNEEAAAGWMVANAMQNNKEWHFVYNGGNQDVSNDAPNQIHFALRKCFTETFNGSSTEENKSVLANAGDYSFTITRMKDSNFNAASEGDEAYTDTASTTGTGAVKFHSMPFSTTDTNSVFYIGNDPKTFYFRITEKTAASSATDLNNGTVSVTKSTGYIDITLVASKDANGNIVYTVDHKTVLPGGGVFKNNSNVGMSGVEFDDEEFFNLVETSSSNNNSNPVTGSLAYTVTDKSNNPVSGAEVKVTAPTGKTIGTSSSKIYTTGADGKISGTELSALELGDYTVEVISYPEGYILDTAADKKKTLTVVTAGVAGVSRIRPSGGLEITVLDEVTESGVPNAEVEVTLPDNTKKTLTTNSAGKILDYAAYETDSYGKKHYTAALGTYKTKVTKVPDGYKVTIGETDIKEVVAGEVKQILAKINTSTGGLKITVLDEKTGNPVPGAQVSVEEPDGSKKTFTTDANGEILNYAAKDANGHYTAKLGKYKMTVTKVPDGYSVTTGATEEKEVTVGKLVEHVAKINTSSNNSKNNSNSNNNNNNNNNSNTNNNNSNNNNSNTNENNNSTNNNTNTNENNNSTNNANANNTNTNANTTNTNSNTTSNDTQTTQVTSNGNTGSNNTSNSGSNNTSSGSNSGSSNSDTSTSNTVTGGNTTGTNVTSTNKTTGSTTTVTSQKTGESKVPYFLFAGSMLAVIAGAVIYVLKHEEKDLPDINL